MGRTVCLYYEPVCSCVDNGPHLKDWWDFCKKHHCEICEENNLNCSTCKDYTSGMHIANECIHHNMCWGDCYYSNKGMCDNKWARNCIGYREE